jgi:hypothetical protein
LLLSDRHQLDGKSATVKCLLEAGKKLGNSVTELTVTNPNELVLNRKSSIGLTGLELLTLAHWLETKDFPLGGLHLPPQVEIHPATRPINPTAHSSTNAQTGRQH